MRVKARRCGPLYSRRSAEGASDPPDARGIAAAGPHPADCTHAAHGRRPRPGARCLGPRAPPPRRRRDRLSGRLQGIPHARRDGRRGRRDRRCPSVDRPDVLDRRQPPGPRAAGGQGVRQRGDRRGRARGVHRRADPRQRADERRDDDPDPPLARRGLRLRQPDHGHRGPDRGLDRVRRQPRRPGVRLRLRHPPQLAQEPPAERRHDRHRHRPQPQLRLSLGRLGVQLQPVVIEVPRRLRVLGARDARRPRLHPQPGHRRPAADQGGGLVPRVRPLRDVAVCRDDRQPPVGHDEPGPGGAGDDRQGDGVRNGYKPMQASDLYVASGTTADWLFGTVPARRVHGRAVRGRLSEGHRDRVRDRAATRTRSCTCSSGPGVRWRS